MAEQLAGKIALVTGGGSGIGRATALTFARAGARVIVADIAREGGEETVHMLKAATGGEAIFVQTNVAKSVEVEALLTKAVETYGRLDCAFNNAGLEGTVQSIVDYEEEQWDRVLAVNLKGVWLCLKYELQQMLKQGGGAIVNAASAAGLVGVAYGSAYAASKHGVVGLTKTAALEYAKANIRVNAVCPGGVRTPMLERLEQQVPGFAEAMVARVEPVGRVGRPEEIAEAVMWLCSEAASFVTGHALAVDGGWVAQ